MKKSFMTRVLATGLSFAMAFSMAAATNVTTASAAAKQASVTSMMKVASKTVTEGKKVTTYMNSSAAKKYRIKSHTESAVTKKYISVVMTSSRKGLTITAKEGALAAANLEKKGVYTKINFAPAKSVAAVKKAAATKYVKLKVVVKAAVKEEEKPVDTFAITSLKATSANELTATFASAVASTGAVTIKVNKAGSTTAIEGTTKWDEALSTLVFTANAKFTAGTYEMTATDVADKTKTATATAVVENEKVAEIVILNDVALTGDSGRPSPQGVRDYAYIYYDVVNQYGESVKNSASITWTVSSDPSPYNNKAVGYLRAQTDAQGGYVYGSSIYVTGVYNKTGVTIQKELKIGMAQNLDSVKPCGFVKKTDKNTILKALPANFQKDQYSLLYQAFDQNGNQLASTHNGAEIETSKGETGSPAVTFISDNVLLMSNTFKDDVDYTIDGEEYNSVKVEPGQYVDKGGEVNITAIANNTGNKTIMNYLIGTSGLLKSVELSQPSEVVADGEKHEIPYVAYDVDGNQITNYESIARTTNTLNLTASEGTLSVVENNDGTAKFVFQDKAVAWSEGTTYDEVARSVALTTVVVGGESNNMILSVDDKARPVAVKNVTFRKDATTAVVEEDSNTLDYKRFVFVDQYGREISQAVDGSNNSNGFLEYISTNSSKWNNKYYAIMGEFNRAASRFTLSAGTGAKVGTSGENNNKVVLETTAGAFTWTTAGVTDEVKNETVKWSIVTTDESTQPTATTLNKYNYCDKTKAISYAVVPMTKVSNISIDATDKQQIKLGLGSKKTGAEAGLEATELPLAINDGNVTVVAGTTVGTTTVDVDHRQTLGVSAAYQGTKVVVPGTYVEYTSAGSKLAIVPDSYSLDDVTNPTSGAIIGASAGALTFGDFFDAKTANFVRKDGKVTVTARVFSTTAGGFDADGNIRRSQALKAKSLNQADLADGDYDAVLASTGWTVDSSSAFQLAAPTTDIVFSDADAAATTIELVGDSCTVTPMLTVISDSTENIKDVEGDSYATTHLSQSLPAARLTWHNKAYGSTKACTTTPRVFDQYNKVMNTTASNWVYTISDIKESTDKLAHLDTSFAVSANATDKAYITGAEVGDTFTLTYKYDNAKASLKVTVGADGFAKISSSTDYDKFFRKHFLSYAY